MKISYDFARNMGLLAAIGILSLLFHTNIAYAQTTQQPGGGNTTDTRPVTQHGNGPTNHYTRKSPEPIRVTGTTQLSDLTICSQPGVTCRNFVPSTATVSVSCNGDLTAGTGGWTVNDISGSCWTSLDVCYGVGTPAETCVSVSGSPATAAMASIVPYTQCVGSDAPSQKNYCVHGTGITGNTGDDMFKVNSGADAFFEYKNMGATLDKPYRLKRIARGAGPAIMMPSGPADYSDFKHFIDHPPTANGMTVEDACYPADVTPCGNVQPTVPVAGVCGAASHVAAGAYPNLAAIPVTGFCYIGNATDKSQTTRQMIWKCAGVNGGADTWCSTGGVNGACPGAPIAGGGPTGPECGVSDDTCGPGDTVSNQHFSGGAQAWDCSNNGATISCGGGSSSGGCVIPPGQYAPQCDESVEGGCQSPYVMHDLREVMGEGAGAGIMGASWSCWDTAGCEGMPCSKDNIPVNNVVSASCGASPGQCNDGYSPNPPFDWQGVTVWQCFNNGNNGNVDCPAGVSFAQPPPF